MLLLVALMGMVLITLNDFSKTVDRFTKTIMDRFPQETSLQDEKKDK
jgi:hypothetical protein